MISLSKQVDYGVQLLMGLAHAPDGSHISLKQFATERNISFLFLQKIAKKLREAGLIISQKGPTGGYQLATDPYAISLKHIVEAIEGPYQPMTCMKKDTCPIETGCPSKNVFSYVQKDIVASMNKYSLQTMIELSHDVSR